MLAELHSPLNRTDVSEWVRLHYEMQRGGFISDAQETDRGWHVNSELSSAPMWNHSALLPGGFEAVEDFLKEAADYHNRFARRPTVYVHPAGLEQASLHNELQHAGFERFDQEAWMVHSLVPVERFEERLRLEEVTVRGGLEKFVEVFNAAYALKDQEHGVAIQKHSSNDERAVHHFLGFCRGTAVCTATLVMRDGVSCIYNVGTHPSQRQRGFGREMLCHLLEFARDSGLSSVLLQVESGSPAERIYKALGFQSLFRRVGYRFAEWRSVSCARGSSRIVSKLSALLGGGDSGADLQPLVGREALALPAQVGLRLRSYCEKNRTPAESILMAAWACLLSRYTGEEVVEFTARFPCDGVDQERSSLISLILNPEIKAADWLTATENAFREAEIDQGSADKTRANESVVFGKSRSRFKANYSSFPIEVSVDVDTLSLLEISYYRDAFKKDAVRRMANHLAGLVQGLLFNPLEPLSRLEMLTISERQQLLVDWNTVPNFPAELPLVPKVFEMQVERTPDALVAIFAGEEETIGARQLTYRQLNHCANKLAHLLQTFGVRPGIFVGVCLNRSVDFVVSLLAILKAGGACVPLDPEYPDERLAFMIEETGAPIIITESALVSRLRIEKTRVLQLDLDAPKIDAGNEKNIASSIRAEDPAYVIYTSGSTGKPKGVMVRHRAIAIHCSDVRQQYGLNSRDRVLQFSSFNFDASFEQILPSLLSGACLVVRGKEVWNIKEFAAKLKTYQLTVADIPTAYWHQLAQEWAVSSETVSSNALRLVIVGGEAMSIERVRLWQQTPLARVRLVNAYGPTETTITATTFEVPLDRPLDSNQKNIPIGRPRGDRKVYILDRYGNPTPVGIPGELFIGGETLADGYLNRSRLTAERFVSDPFSDDPQARLYRTGDLCRYLDDGNIEFLGRVDDQVKIRGFRIELGEIEMVLSQHPEIRETVLLARENPKGEKCLVAYMVAPRRKPEVSEMRAYLRSRLPEYMIPSAFIMIDALPLMPNGKVDRRALPWPERESQPIGLLKGPNDPLELQLQLAFERVLNRVPIAIDASFFELGGDSLQALELIVEIERLSGKGLPLSVLYQSPSVEKLAKELQKQGGTVNRSCLVPLQTRGHRPPLYLIHTTPGDILGYGNLVYHLGSDQPCHGFQSIGMIDPARSHTSIHRMAAHYVAMLRGFQRNGPYYFGGWCYGGVVAVEMARLLLNAGEKVGLLALFETVAMPPRLTNYRYYFHRLNCSAHMSLRKWAIYGREKLNYLRDTKMANRMRFREVESSDSNSTDDENTKTRLARLERVYNTNLIALKRYRSSYYPGTVTLFNAEEKDPALVPDPQYGWVGLAGKIEIHTVPGGHDSMLGEPHVGVLAQKLQACLHRAQEQNDV